MGVGGEVVVKKRAEIVELSDQTDGLRRDHSMRGANLGGLGV
jgi:hypothetical protein